MITNICPAWFVNIDKKNYSPNEHVQVNYILISSTMTLNRINRIFFSKHSNNSYYNTVLGHKKHIKLTDQIYMEWWLQIRCHGYRRHHHNHEMCLPKFVNLNLTAIFSKTNISLVILFLRQI